MSDGRCETCLNGIPPSRTEPRICAKCGEVIQQHHKYFMRNIEALLVAPDGLSYQFRRKVTVLEHRHCDNPDSYHPLDCEGRPR